MYCPTCNTPNRDDAKFCKSCGHPLHANVVAQAVAPAPNEAVMNPIGGDLSSPLQGNVESQPPAPTPAQTNTEEIEDISAAPTEILTPEKMAAIHKRRLQQEQEQQMHYGQAATSQPQTRAANGNADIPVVWGGTSEAQNQQSAAAPITSSPASSSQPEPTAQAQDIADVPTVSMTPSQENEDVSIPPPVSQANTASIPAETTQTTASSQPLSSQSSETAAMTNGAAVPEEATTQEKSDIMQQTPYNQSEQAGQENVAAPLAGSESGGLIAKQSPDTTQSMNGVQSIGATPSSDFSPLAAGTMMLERYEITQVLSESPQEHVYQVIDRQGYQHCWNCGSEQNAEGDEFCIDCGASLLNVPYIMHEYAPVGAPSTDAHTDAPVLQGNIVNTFVEQNRTYVIEQPQVAHSAFPNGVHLLAGGDSDAGDVRRSEPNEDSILILQLQRVHESIAAPAGVFIVADGLGGHDNGQVASRMTINIIAERMVRELLSAPLASEKSGGQANLPDEDGLVAMFHGAIEDANTALVQVNQRDKTDMGSTITGFMIAGDHAYIINVGDSRTYMLRGKQLYQLTTDHSLVAQLVAGGLIEPDEIYTHPQRSQIFRSLGDKPNVQIDVFKQQLHPGDILLSCSDGLWEMVRNPQIESILNDAPDPQTACTQLIEAANTNGGDDNVSAVIVYVR